MRGSTPTTFSTRPTRRNIFRRSGNFGTGRTSPRALRSWSASIWGSPTRQPASARDGAPSRARRRPGPPAGGVGRVAGAHRVAPRARHGHPAGRVRAVNAGADGHRPALIAGFLGWTLDAFDFFLVVLCLSAIARD